MDEAEKRIFEKYKEDQDMDYAKMIDHTLLKPEASREQVKKLCQEAVEYGFHSVCVNSCYVSFCADLLKDSDVKVCTVIGFPLGAMSSAGKAAEAAAAVKDGADELDMVINVGMIKSGDWEYVRQDIEGVVEAAGSSALVKGILETCLLTEDEKRRACRVCRKAGAAFVKTSTGFSTGGATAADVRLMRAEAGDSMGVKASGGIRSLKDAEEMADAGADRIGTSSGIAIVREQKGLGRSL